MAQERTSILVRIMFHWSCSLLCFRVSSDHCSIHFCSNSFPVSVPFNTPAWRAHEWRKRTVILTDSLDIHIKHLHLAAQPLIFRSRDILTEFDSKLGLNQPAMVCRSLGSLLSFFSQSVMMYISWLWGLSAIYSEYLAMLQKPMMLYGHTRAITQIRYNREGDLLFSAAKDATPNVWFSINGERLGTFDGHNGAVWCIDVNCILSFHHPFVNMLLVLSFLHYWQHCALYIMLVAFCLHV